MNESDNTLSFDGATFRITKLLPVDSKRLFIHHVRPLLSGAAKAKMSEGEGGTGIALKMMVSAFTQAPSDHYDHISRTMARRIEVQREDGKKFLAGNESWAFQGLSGAHALAVDMKAFTVNFTEWWDVLTQEFPYLLTLMESIGMPTSTLSSLSSSTPESGDLPSSTLSDGEMTETL